MLFSFITFSMYAGAENNVEYDVKSYYKSEYFNSYINILLTKDDKTSLIVNIDCVKANLFLSEGKGFKHYRPKGKEYPDLHASFVNLKDNLPIVGDYKKVMVGSYDAYYKLAASKSVYEVWDFVCLIHIPELELPGGPKFLIQFDLRNRYGYKSKELPFEDYYGIEAQNKIEADFLKILNAISISYEDSNGNISQGGGAGQTVTNEAGSTTGYDAKSSADIPKDRKSVV